MAKKSVTRFVITHIGKYGLRTLTSPQQGRFTYATAKQAQKSIDDMHTNNSQETLTQHFGLPLEVRACPCYPGHFDPKGIYFE